MTYFLLFNLHYDKPCHWKIIPIWFRIPKCLVKMFSLVSLVLERSSSFSYRLLEEQVKTWNLVFSVHKVDKKKEQRNSTLISKLINWHFTSLQVDLDSDIELQYKFNDGKNYVVAKYMMKQTNKKQTNKCFTICANIIL